MKTHLECIYLVVSIPPKHSVSQVANMTKANIGGLCTKVRSSLICCIDTKAIYRVFLLDNIFFRPITRNLLLSDGLPALA